MDINDHTANRTSGAASSQDGNAYDIGAQFDAAGWNFSLGYYREEQAGAVADTDAEVLDVAMLSARYTLGPGVQWRTSIFQGTRHGEETADNNSTDAFGVVTGLNLSF